MSDKSWIVRVAALNALARRNVPTPLAQIAAALDDIKDTVQYTAAATVVHLSEIPPPPKSNPEKPKPKAPDKAKKSQS